MKAKPIKSKEHYSLLANHLKELSTRDFLLFTLSTGKGLKVPYLLSCKLYQILELLEGQTEQNLLNQLIKTYDLKKTDYTFLSQDGEKPLTYNSYDRILKRACSKCQLDLSYSSESLRKTYYYTLFVNGTSLKEIKKMLGHPYIGITSDFLCLDKDDQILHLTNSEGSLFQ